MLKFLIKLLAHFLLLSPSFLIAFQVHSSNDAPVPLGYAVASANPLATNAGLEIMAEGGNAFDAAVAVSAVLAVVEPYHSGLGGGGFWLLHQAKNNKNIFIDGREVAPGAASRDMFLDADRKPVPELSLNGGLAAAIPGEPAALVLIAKRFGRLPLTRSLAPAIRIAEQGFMVDHHFDSFIKMGDRLQQMQKYKSAARVFLCDGKPYLLGQRIVQNDLAKTLKLLSEQGHDGFYRGEVAKRLVSAVHEAGGIWTTQDLANYQVKVREPLHGKFHNIDVITAPPPSAGGVSVLIMLNILSVYPSHSLSTAQWIHYVLEAMRLAYWQRMELLADPDFVQIPLAKLLSVENANNLRRLIFPNRATASGSLKKKALDNNGSNNTTHFSIIDSEGNYVAATLSINYIFGSSVLAEGTGVLLNDEMDDFAIAPGEENVFGLVGGEKNAIVPGKRPLSSMTPTFLQTSSQVAIFGTPGGSRIPTMVLLSALVFNDSYGAISMVSAMRFHHQYLPDKLQFEPNTFSLALQTELRDMGYHLDPLDAYYGDMQAITWDRKTNLLTASSDPRNIGQGTVVNKMLKKGYGLNH